MALRLVASARLNVAATPLSVSYARAGDGKLSVQLLVIGGLIAGIAGASSGWFVLIVGFVILIIGRVIG